MITLLVIIIILASLLLGFIILIQNSRWWFGFHFAGQNQVLGVKRTTDFLEKATGLLLAVIMVSCMTIAIIVRTKQKFETSIQDTGKLKSPQN